MRTVIRLCAFAIGIWILLASPESLERAVRFFAALQPAGTDNSTFVQFLMQSIFGLRLAAIWVVFHTGLSLLASAPGMRKFQSRPLPDFSNADHHGRTLWTR